jgi:hypothetical protein
MVNYKSRVMEHFHSLRFQFKYADQRRLTKYLMLALLCWGMWAANDARAHVVLAAVCLSYGVATLLWLKKPANRLSLDPECVTPNVGTT